MEVKIFLVLHIHHNFGLHIGYFQCYSTRFWVLLKFFGECWYFYCNRSLTWWGSAHKLQISFGGSNVNLVFCTFCTSPVPTPVASLVPTHCSFYLVLSCFCWLRSDLSKCSSRYVQNFNNNLWGHFLEPFSHWKRPFPGLTGIFQVCRVPFSGPSASNLRLYLLQVQLHFCDCCPG